MLMLSSVTFLKNRNSTEVKFEPRILKEENCQGFEIDIDKLPKDVKIIRFCNSLQLKVFTNVDKRISNSH